MSLPGPPADGAAPSRRNDVPVWVVGVAIGVMIAMVVAVVLMLTHDSSGKPKESYPNAWDPRIAPYASIAEKERGLLFKHPVRVLFLSPTAFEKTVTTDEGELDKADREELEQYSGLLRAFGLIAGDIDLFDALNEASSAGTLAYYSLEDKQITVRGTSVTTAVRATLVHELTHVLQDQYFDIGDRMAALDKASEKGDSATQAEVLRSIIEGDAVRVEDLYRRSLPASQRKAMAAAEKEDQRGGRQRLAEVPAIVVTMQSSPYVLGQGLVKAVATKGGNKGVDALLRDSPTHENVLLDPMRVLGNDTSAELVARPTLEPGEKKFDSGEFGVVSLYLMLAERLPLAEALAAADGWGGDAYVAYDRDDEACARMTFQGRTTRDSARMGTALVRWVRAGPSGSASVSRSGETVTVQSCDPGADAAGGRDVSERALALVATRTAYAVTILEAGAAPGVAQCLAAGVVDAYPLSRLQDPRLGSDPVDAARIQRLAAGCR